MKKIPLVDLSHSETEATVIREVGRVIKGRVFTDELVIKCPKSGRRQGVKACGTCPHMQGIGKVKIRPGQEEVRNEQVYRVMCNYAMFRNLHPSSMPKTAKYKKELSIAISAHPLKPDKLKSIEKALFVDGNKAIYCPISRAQAGVWEVNNPPCPACPCYSGVRFVTIDGRKTPQVACTHVKARAIHSPQSGSLKMLEGFENGCAV